MVFTRKLVRRSAGCGRRASRHLPDQRKTGLLSHGFFRSVQRYRSRWDPHTVLRMRLNDLAAVTVHYGYRRPYVLRRRKGWAVNHKRIDWPYVEEGLSIRTKLPRRKRARRIRQKRLEVGGTNEAWSLDFMVDRLFDGHSFRILTVLDICTREALSTIRRASFRTAQVVEALDQLVRARGKPRSLRMDNGPEFAERLLGHWSYLNQIAL